MNTTDTTIKITFVNHKAHPKSVQKRKSDQSSQVPSLDDCQHTGSRHNQICNIYGHIQHI